jgi:4-amino-4-deoxychorismate lyase
LPSILINGQETEQISVLDRGFQYGDGLFETIHVVDGGTMQWQRHMTRLAEGCERLGIPMLDQALLATEAEKLCRGVSEGVLKLTVTRGMGGRGYAMPGPVSPTRVLALFPAPTYPETHWTKGVKVRICQTRLGENPSLAGIKHLNRLEQVLARAEWDDPDISEGLMLDSNNNVIEGTMSNLFCVHDGVLLTPELSRCGVRGITRDRILLSAEKAGIPAKEAQLAIEDINNAQELFLSNSLVGIWPVKQLEKNEYSAGPITKQLMAALKDSNE